MDVVASLPAEAQAAKTVEPGDGAPDDVAEDTQTDAAGLGTRALSRIVTPIAAHLHEGKHYADQAAAEQVNLKPRQPALTS
ncbi:hypothetical protein [Streptomyces olivaceoviridis]